MRLIHIIFLFFIILFSGCGGSSDGVSLTNKTKIATLNDTLINGIEYRCGTKIVGITGDIGVTGGFRYQDDCTVEFKIGKIYLGSIDGNSIASHSNPKIFITNILGLQTTNTSDRRLWQELRLLQTLDSDNDTSNGITITQDIRNKLNSRDVLSLDFTQVVEDEDLNSTVIQADENNTLVNITKAVSHFEATLNNNGYVIDTVAPDKPFLTHPFNQIFTIQTKKRVVEINGEEGSKIWVGFNTTGDDNNVTFIDQNITIGTSWRSNLTLDFDNDDISHFYYYIKLVDSYGHQSEVLSLDILKDFIPPVVAEPIIYQNVLEEQKLLRNINAHDPNGKIKEYELVPSTEDNRSNDNNLFVIDSNGSLTFKVEPDYDDNINAVFNVVARALDYTNNMTDVYIRVFLQNILDNPPKLTASTYITSLMEGEANGTIVYDLNTTLEHNLTLAPDNDPALSPIYFKLHNYTDIFDLNISTGKLTIKDDNDTLFNYEQLPNSVDLNISIENNNSAQNNDINITYTTLTVDILNHIDTTPVLKIPSDVNISEHNSNQGVILTIEKDESNCDRNLSMVFSIVNSDGNFTIDSTSGEITRDGDNLDFESQTEHNLTIRAENTWWDGSIHSDDVNLTIGIDNVIDNAPIIINTELNSSIPESTDVDIKVAQLEVNGTIWDENQTNTYQISEIDKNGISISDYPFQIDNNGVVTTNRQLLTDYVELIDQNDTIFSLTIKATNVWWDNVTHDSNIITFDINVTNVIDNIPVLVPIPSVSFEENATTGTTVTILDVNGSIYDENNVTSYHIRDGNDENKFDLNTSSGEIYINDTLDWETTTTYNIGVVATNIWYDGSSHDSVEKTFTINITNIIEHKPDVKVTEDENITIHENIDSNEIIAIVEPSSNATDDRSVVDGQHITKCEIVGGNDGNFTMDEVPVIVDGLPRCELKIAEDDGISPDTNDSYNITLDINITNDCTDTDNCTATKSIHIDTYPDIKTDKKLFTIGINFTDANLTTLSDDDESDYIEALIYGTTTNKLQNYIATTSFNKFRFLAAADENDSTVNGVLVVDINNTLSGGTGSDSKIKATIQDALTLADDNLDFSTYDENGDGNISKDELELIFLLPGDHITSDGTNILKYADSAEGLGDTNSINLDGVDIDFTNGASYVVAPANDGNATIGLIGKYLLNSFFGFKIQDTDYKYYYLDILGDGYHGADDGQVDGTMPVNISAYYLSQQGWIKPTPYHFIHDKSNIIFATSNMKVSADYVNNIFSIVSIPDKDDSKNYYLMENRNYNDNDDGSLSYYDNGVYNKDNKQFDGGLVIWKVTPTTIKQVDISNSTDNIFRPTNSTGDLSNSSFDFNNDTGTIDSNNGNQYTISIGEK